MRGGGEGWWAEVRGVGRMGKVRGVGDGELMIDLISSFQQNQHFGNILTRESLLKIIGWKEFEAQNFI